MRERIWVTTFPRMQGRIYLGCNCGWRHDTGEGMPSLASINTAALAHSLTCEVEGVSTNGDADG